MIRRWSYARFIAQVAIYRKSSLVGSPTDPPDDLGVAEAATFVARVAGSPITPATTLPLHLPPLRLAIPLDHLPPKRMRDGHFGGRYTFCDTRDFAGAPPFFSRLEVQRFTLGLEGGALSPLLELSDDDGVSV